MTRIIARHQWMNGCLLQATRPPQMAWMGHATLTQPTQPRKRTLTDLRTLLCSTLVGLVSCVGSRGYSNDLHVTQQFPLRQERVLAFVARE